MKKQIKLEAQAQTTQSAQKHTQAAASQEFASVEEMLRHDALHTPVPPNVAHRLRQSLGPLDAPTTPWWKRWMKRKS